MKIIYDWPDGNDPRVDVWLGVCEGRLKPEDVLKQIQLQANLIAKVGELLEQEKSKLPGMRASLKNAVQYEKWVTNRIECELAEYEKSNP